MILSASMMCANYSALGEEVHALSNAGLDMFHIDIMDGSFVPNIAMGRQDIAAIRKLSLKPLDAHLMVSKPSNYLDVLLEEGVDIIYIHPETDDHIVETLKWLKSRNVAPGIAVSPELPFAYFQDVLPFADYVLLMTVVPGFAGQAFLENSDPKIDEFIAGKQQFPYRLMLDGAISPSIVRHYNHKGVDGFVLGTSSLFKAGSNYANVIKELRQAKNDEY